jgi:hypothetical protein
MKGHPYGTCAYGRNLIPSGSPLYKSKGISLSNLRTKHATYVRKEFSYVRSEGFVAFKGLLSHSNCSYQEHGRITSSFQLSRWKPSMVPSCTRNTYRSGVNTDPSHVLATLLGPKTLGCTIQPKPSCFSPYLHK